MTLMKRSTIFDDAFDKLSLFNIDNSMSLKHWHVLDDIFHVQKDDAGISVSLDLPGVKAADVDISVEGRRITIVAKQRGRTLTYYYELTRKYDTESASANLEDGVLTLRFDILPEEKPKRLKINVK